MFCPKCGNTLPDGAAFCGGCGNKIATEAKPAAVGVVGGPAVAAPVGAVPASKGKLSSTQLATIIVAVIALIFAFMPWFETSSALLSYGTGIDALSNFGSSLTGKNYGSLNIEESYSPVAFFELSKSVWHLPAGGIKSLEGPLDAPCGFTELFWILGVAIVVLGLIVMLASAKRSVGALIAGSAILGLTSIVWNFIYPSLVSGGYAKGWPFNALLCAAACIAVIVLAATAKNNQYVVHQGV